MSVNIDNYRQINRELGDKVQLVAVSKLKSVEEVKALYDLGHRDFGENYVQELLEKQARLPADIRWHFIGHLQSNKAKYIVPFIYLIQGVDSTNLLREINKQAKKAAREVNVLLQVHIAEEESKYGLNEEELNQVMNHLADFQHIRVKGLMGMASFSDDTDKVKSEFRYLKWLFDRIRSAAGDTHDLQLLSMGMSGDYKLAIEEGSNMVRIGSLLFGARMKP
jgi:pyridoxal phosphate enzyme (YggS family)